MLVLLTFISNCMVLQIAHLGWKCNAMICTSQNYQLILRQIKTLHSWKELKQY